MLTNDILNALKGYTANMKNDVTFVVQSGEHEKKVELLKFLNGFASVSEKLSVEERDVNSSLRSPVSFLIERDGQDTGIRFSGIPGGHEFNSLVLAVLHASGTDMKLDASIKNIISAAKEALSFEVFVSLSCHNCPDVVQALNQFALLNPNISVEMIDGGVYPELIEDRNIQGVPSVYLNGELFANGKIDESVLLDRLLDKFPGLTQDVSVEPLSEQDVVVIGGGPAGVSAAIYSARKGLKVTLVADRIGGQVKDTMGIENLISIPQTTGPELTNALHTHIKEYDITVREHFRVSKLDKANSDNLHKLELSSGERIHAKAVIVATGAKWRELGIPGEKAYIGQGVAYCPHCDGPFFKGKDVAVIGGGNSGVEAALDLAGIVRSVTIYEFMPELKADQVLVDQAERRENITIKKNVATKEVIGEDGKVVALAYEERENGELKQQELSGIFVQIGLVPNSDFLEGVVERSQFGEIIIDERGRTSAEGIYACGDVTTVPYKQIVVAMGEGAKAALSAYDHMLVTQ